MRALDTNAEAHAVQIDVYRRMSPARRLELAFEMCELGREILTQGILARAPGLGREGARRAILAQLLGESLFRSAYPETRRALP